jgi:flagellar biosynthesis GTPase FlhF
MNKMARATELTVTHMAGMPAMDDDMAKRFLAIFAYAKDNHVLTDTLVSQKSEEYLSCVLRWAKKMDMDLPYGNAPMHTCLDQQQTAHIIKLLELGMEAGNKMWGGDGGGAAMSPEDRALIASSFIFTDDEACAMYFPNGRLSEERGVKRTLAALLTFRAAEFPQIGALAAGEGIHAANESARSNINHVCYPALVSLVKFVAGSEQDIYLASNYIIGESENAIARVLPRTCEDAYDRLAKKMHVIKMKDGLDARLIPNYCLTRKKFEVAVRVAAARKTVRICNVDELGYTGYVPEAADALWTIYQTMKNNLENAEVFGLAQVAKRLLNGVQIVPVLSIMGGMKTSVGGLENYGSTMYTDGSIHVEMPDKRFDIFARNWDIATEADVDPKTSYNTPKGGSKVPSKLPSQNPSGANTNNPSRKNTMEKEQATEEAKAARNAAANAKLQKEKEEADRKASDEKKKKEDEAKKEQKKKDDEAAREKRKKEEDAQRQSRDTKKTTTTGLSPSRAASLERNTKNLKDAMLSTNTGNAGAKPKGKK